MVLQRGDVVLIPFPYTDLSTAKTRPAVVISSPLYHTLRSELLLAYISSQVTKAHPQLDYLLLDWKASHLPKPSFVRPKIASIEPNLVIYRVGHLSVRDLQEVDSRLRKAMALTQTALYDVIAEVKFSEQPPSVVQTIAEKATSALVMFAQTKTPGIDLEVVRQILKE